MHWRLSYHRDPAALALDRHYSRKKPGTRSGMMPPGRQMVLVADDVPALWGLSWPYAELVKHAWPGAMICTIFRNENRDVLSSTLIREACAAARWKYGVPPGAGLITFVNRRKVRSKRNPGYCFLCAGFEPAGHTKGGLEVLRLHPDVWPHPEAPRQTQRRLL